MVHNVPPSQPTTMGDRTYRVLKQISLVWLPGLSTLYFALNGIWGLPYTEQIVGTIAAVNVFLGLLVNQSSKNFNNSDIRFDGDIHTDGDQLYNLQLNKPVQESTSNGELRLKVNTEEPAAA